MAIDADKQMVNQITSCVYQWLFGMTRAEMLTEYKKHMADRVISMSDDEDEYMRDHLSIAALNCLSGAERAIASYITRNSIHVFASEDVINLYFLLRPYRVEGIIVWRDEG